MIERNYSVGFLLKPLQALSVAGKTHGQEFERGFAPRLSCRWPDKLRPSRRCRSVQKFCSDRSAWRPTSQSACLFVNDPGGEDQQA